MASVMLSRQQMSLLVSRREWNSDQRALECLRSNCCRNRSLYTVALPKVCERLVETALRIPDVDGRKIMQFGIVSTSVVSVDEMPPGIKTLIETTIKPWGEQEAYTIQVASILNNNSDFSDRCIHTITNPEDKETIPTVSLDWQRTFKTPRFLRKNVLEEIVPRGRDEALAYFEQLGEKGAVHV